MLGDVQPQIRPSFACRLRPKEHIGREGPVPYMGEVELENCSAYPLEIEYTMTALQHLEVIIARSDGKVVSEGYFSDRFSPTAEPLVLRLLPGEKFAARVSLLATLPRDKRTSGTYLVQAVYQYNGLRAVSDTVEVVIP